MSYFPQEIPTNPPSSLEPVFARMDLFKDLPSRAIQHLAAQAVLLRAYSGQVLIEEGDSGADLFILLKGRVRVQVESINPWMEIGLNKLDEGEAFGEMALIEDEPRCATVMAVEVSDFARIPAESLRALLADDPGSGVVLMRNLARILSGRLKQMNRRLLNMTRSNYL